jgi:hypothetical protein
MKNKKGHKAPEQSQDKNTNYLSPIQTIKGLLKQGGKYTAKQLNTLTRSNDARKCISDLRKCGMSIIDRRLPTMEKQYWLADDGQLKLGRS